MALLVTACLASPAVAEEKPAEEPSEEAPPEPVGFDFGAYYLKQSRSLEGAKAKLTFTLHAEVAGENADRFEDLLKDRTQRVRDQVITAARITPPTDFQDPELRLFRRRILVRLSRSLPELAVDDVYFSDFRYLVE